jgi:hypothetical protein
MSPLRTLPLLLAILLASLPGCIKLPKPNWSHDAGESKMLSPARMAEDSVVLEVMFVYIAPQDNAADSALWQQLDETHLPIPLRQQLDANGIRAGLIGGSLPEPLLALMQDERNTTDLQQRAGNLATATENRMQRMQCRDGQPGRIVVSPSTHRQLAVVIVEGDYLRGHTFQQAQCLLGLRTYALGDGRARIHLIPEIHYGDATTQFVGQEGAWMLKSDRAVASFKDLELNHVLAPGQTLLLTTSPTAHGLGGSFFTDIQATSDTQILVLVRLAQTQQDDLFATDQGP